MKKRMLGRTGFPVSEIGLGAWPFGNSDTADYGKIDEEEAIRVIKKYVDLGGNFIDTARAYGERSERLVGEAMRRYFDRERVYIATKTFAAQTRDTIKQIRIDLEESLRILQMEYVDVFQLHQPPEDIAVMSEALDELLTLKEEGKIRSIGASIKGPNVTDKTVELCRQYMDSGKVDSIQIVYSILRQKLRGIIDEAAEKNIGVIVRTVLESGLLTGIFKPGHTFTGTDQRTRYNPEHLQFILEAVDTMGKEISLQAPYENLAQLAIKFSLMPEGISTLIIGAQEEWQVDANIKVADFPDIDAETLQYVKDKFSGITEKANYQ